MYVFTSTLQRVHLGKPSFSQNRFIPLLKNAHGDAVNTERAPASLKPYCHCSQ